MSDTRTEGQPETVRSRIAQALADARKTGAHVVRAVAADGGEPISQAYVYLVMRGGGETGAKADRVRAALSKLTGRSVEFLFMHAELALTDAVSSGEESHGNNRTRPGSGTPGGVAG